MTAQNLYAYFLPHTLHFKKPSGTSRGILHERKVWYLIVYQKNNPAMRGIGECAPLKGLSVDDRSDFESVLQQLCNDIHNYPLWLRGKLRSYPSIKFALETAMLDFCNSGQRILYPSRFTEGKDFIRTNGLIWMGDFRSMKKQVEEKIAAHFSCIKLKIGAIDFNKELDLLRFIREEHAHKKIELRVDANGAFAPKDAMKKLEQLAQFDIHSIEQPIRHGQWKAMQALCRSTPVPIALDEELIGIRARDEKRKLLDAIQPQYIILKPTLVGGFTESQEWIKAAHERNIGWWITSALESNIGLNAIAQWTYALHSKMPQGLGTGKLFTNNFTSPLSLKSERLFFNPELPPFPSFSDVKGKTVFKKQLCSFMKEWGNDAPHLVAHTSGTTGKPKAILIEKQKMLHSALLTLRFLQVQPNETALLCLSTDYIAGKMLVVRAATGLLQLLPVEPAANPLLSIPPETEIAFASFVPLQVQEILKNKKTAKQFARITNVLIGGAPVSPELRKKLSSIKNNVYETYGMTETVSHVALKRLSAPVQKSIVSLTNYFETLPGITVKKDKRGCLVIHAPALAEDPIITNDLVELKSNRHFKWLGRIDNVVNSGGVKLIPEALEEKVKHLIHRRFYFTGVPDKHLGSRLALILEGAALTPSALKKLRNKLSRALNRYEIPKEILFMTKFKGTSTGKLKRIIP